MVTDRGLVIATELPPAIKKHPASNCGDWGLDSRRGRYDLPLTSTAGATQTCESARHDITGGCQPSTC